MKTLVAQLLLLPLLGCNYDAYCSRHPLDPRLCSHVELKQPDWPSAYGSLPELKDEATALFSRYRPVRIDVSVTPELWRHLNENAILLDETTSFVQVEVSIDGEDMGAVGLRPKGGTGTLRNCFNEDSEESNEESQSNGESQNDSDDRTDGDRSGDELVALQDIPGLECPKLSYKLKFDKFQRGLHFKGLRRLNLHSLVKDPSLMRDFLAYGLFRRMGVAAPRVNYTELYVNGTLLGLFALVEEVDEVFLASRFPDAAQGNLYKNQWLTGGTVASYEANLRTNQDGSADHSGFVLASEQFRTAKDTTLPDVMSRWLDVERFVSFLEVEQAMLNWDGPLSIYHTVEEPRDRYRSHNFYLYHPTPGSKFMFIPWDMDNSLDGYHPHLEELPDYRDLSIDCERDSPLASNRENRYYLPPSCDGLIRAAALSGGIENRTRLLDDLFRVDVMNELIDWQENRLTTAIERDPTLELSRWWRKVDELKDAVEVLVERAGSFEQY